MAAGRQELATSFDSSELHSAPQSGADFLYPSDEKAELLPTTFTDVVEWMQWKNTWINHEIKPREQQDRQIIAQLKSSEYQAKKKIYTDIAWHEQISRDPGKAYDELLDLFYQARLQANRPTGLLSQKSPLDKSNLGGLLVVHNLIREFSGRGLAIRHSTLAERDAGVDLAIPVSQSDPSTINLLIQPGSSKTAPIRLIPASARRLLLHLPERFGQGFSSFTAEDIDLMANHLAQSLDALNQKIA